MKTKILLLLLALLPAALLAADADKLAISGVAQMYTPSNVANNNWSGGGTTQSMLFDGTKTAGVCMPEWGSDGRRSWPDQYMVFDLGALLSGGYFVSYIKVWQESAYKYSLYFSTDGGSSYEEVENGISVSSADPDGAEYFVGTIATHVKIVFHELSGYSGGTSEIAVWGIDPAQMGCQHPSFTEWEPVDGSATCTKKGIDRHKCLVCGEVSERPSELLPPLGHAYVSTLVTPGTSSSFGSGAISCERCDWSAVFNIPVDLTSLGGVVSPGIVQFTDLSVSSEWHPEWEGGVALLVDGVWELGEKSYWAAETLSHDEWAEFDFGTEIDLTKIKFLVPNHDHSLDFYKVEDGVETLIGTVAVASVSGASFQLKEVEFRGVSLDKLRIRVSDSIGVSHWGRNVVQIYELHPYGTVKGAGKLNTTRTRILLY